MPKLAFAVLFLALVALASTTTYTGFLLVGVVSHYLGTGRFLAGLLLGVLFARLPWISQGKLRTVGLLPRRARLPVLISLLSLCLLHFIYRGEMLPVLFLGFTTSFLLFYRRLRQALVNRAVISLLKPSLEPERPGNSDKAIIDVEFKEKKD